ncbi:MAG: hypothetical protein COU07_02720 [Candidatus Harrisonbacteria bacterium CG10_big_fil_rev_8_21_14_0_10_40_38]|uniref:YdbS-like PH domain-containing protein n=1 Tax=Candidatus Harrisonbacteria bacterium CG10_big_fil_rev_8_21_14_0_10_40_38 TaxID=1974583 RepID=A0A2H0URS2_9BACT|nr:MAG: hypothetical protein COU07_02720 [Candidatus Harrisonbacteria bacterium CG10_big_fil_rev_8_21_14_0_10_40_38]
MFDLDNGEKIIYVCRRHWLIFLSVIFQIILPMIIIVIAPIFLNIFFGEITGNYKMLIFMGAALIFEALWVVLFAVIMDYYLDIWLITNQRLVFIEVKGMFNRTVSSVSFENIQDVSTEVKGIIATLFGYGNVRIQSAGTTGLFVFKQVPLPYRVKDLIIHAKESSSASGKKRDS